MSKKILQENCKGAYVRKVLFKEHNYEMTKDNTTYYVKVLSVHANSILSVNSKYVWEIRSGKVDGLNFKTSSVTRLNMKEFNKLPNKIVVFKNKPHKILEYVNESEVLDISDKKVIFDIKVFNQLKDVKI